MDISKLINEYPELIPYIDVIQTQPEFLNHCTIGNHDNVALVFYSFAYDIIHDRWPEAEPYIMQDPRWAYMYALNVIRDRWPEAESYIMLDVYYACAYVYTIDHRIRIS